MAARWWYRDSIIQDYTSETFVPVTALMIISEIPAAPKHGVSAIARTKVIALHRSLGARAMRSRVGMHMSYVC